jgi:tRNA threonylcarbamoyladenosine biosynthesis protein TsaE
VQSVELESHSAGETERAAGEVAEGLRAGDVVLITGEVGTGKTTFVRGACEALRVTERVTSPSFVIGRTYAGRIPVSHIDLFRLETLEGEDPALLSDYLTPDSVAFVEWPEAAGSELEPERVALQVRLAHLGGDRRRVEAAGRPDLVARIRQALGDGGLRSAATGAERGQPPG